MATMSRIPQPVRRGRTWLWALPALAWLLFCAWYTNTSGPLTEDEIAAFAAQAERSGRPAEVVQRLRRFMAGDSGDQFLMANLIDMADDDETAALSAEASMDRYMAHMYPELFRRACHPILGGPVVFHAMDLVGIEGAESWGSFAIMRYRSRRDLMEIALNPVFDEKHDFKMAALDKTIAVPVEPQLYLADPRPLLFLVLFFVVAVADALLFRRRRGA